VSWTILETAQEELERSARGLQRTLDERGFARFPPDHPAGWDHERLVEARRGLFASIEWLADNVRDVGFYTLTDGTLIVEWWSDEDAARFGPQPDNGQES
jgi:hypothetical protein